MKEEKQRKGEEKRMKSKLQKHNKTRGITLIALVVTIIILIILATVSINVVFGEGGLIKRAEIAKQIYENNAKNEEEQMNEIAQNMGEYMNSNDNNKDKEIEVESISLDKTTLKIGIGNTLEALNVTFTPANATNKKVTWSSNSETIATVNEKGEITAVAKGTATITATSSNGKTATCNVTIIDEMTISEAKAEVTSYETLKQYIGTKITDYNPTAGGTWRIFYYDEAGDFGTAGKLYLKRDYVSNDITLSSYKSYTPSAQGLEIMKTMNPKWRDYPTAGANTIDLENEHCVAWICDPVNWTDYKTTEADYAIGSPSVEMYMKAFNVWKAGNKDATNLICKVESANGYSVGANEIYDNDGYYTNRKAIEEGPNNIFMTAGSNYWWLASPSSHANYDVLFVRWQRTRE